VTIKWIDVWVGGWVDGFVLFFFGGGGLIFSFFGCLIHRTIDWPVN
jgi:hypothetical protein